MKKIIKVVLLLLLNSVAFSHGISDADKIAMLNGGNLQYIWLGLTHMISGYDHLLFLFGVVFFLTNIKDIIKFVSIFTIGHSITLIFATFMDINANYYLVDAVIAISVIYKAFDNNQGFQHYFGFKKSPNILLLVFVFGLIHGFGLSTRLQQLPLGDQSYDILIRIISFNIGVEAGQIIALIIMLTLLQYLRKTKKFAKYSKIANHFIMFLGFLLLIMQLHGYLHTTNPEDLGFASKTHLHIHEDMEIKNMKKFNLE